MSEYANNMRGQLGLQLRVRAEQLTTSELEIAILDLAISYDAMPPSLVRTYCDAHPDQMAALIGPLAVLLPRVARYHLLADEAQALGLYPTGPLLTRMRAVRDACELAQPCIIYSYIALLDPQLADQQWSLAPDTRDRTYEQQLARVAYMLDDAIQVTEAIVDETRARHYTT